MTALLTAGPHGQLGQGLAEYALILSLIVVLAIAALALMGGQISSILSTIAQSI